LPYRGPPRRHYITKEYVLTSPQRQNPRRGVWVCDGGVEAFCSQRSKGSLSGHQRNEAVGQVEFVPGVACSGTGANRVFDPFSCSSTFHAGGPHCGLKPAIDFPALAGPGRSAVCLLGLDEGTGFTRAYRSDGLVLGQQSQNRPHIVLFRRS
jgi:hypothetical protein